MTSGSLGLVAAALFKATPAVLGATAGLVSLSLYVILWPVASALRLKRLLLNLHPHADSKLRSIPASWSMTRSTGVYDLERESFATLGARVPSEPPLDLLVSLPVPICWIVLWGYFLAFVTISTVPSPGLLVTLILAIEVLCCSCISHPLPSGSPGWRRPGGHATAVPAPSGCSGMRSAFSGAPSRCAAGHRC